MQKKQKFYADQRWDKPHYDTMIGFIEAVFQAFNQYGITPNSKVITGWSIIVDSGLTVKVDQTNPSALIISDRVGFENLQWHTSSDTPLTIAVADDDISYIEVQFTSTTSDSQTIALWDSLADSGAGAEFTQAADTTDEQIATLVTNTTGFSGDADKLPLATVTASSGVITTPIPDSREKLFSSETTFDFGAPETDQEINSLKDMFEAIAAVILRDKNALTGSALTDWFAVPPVLPSIVDPYDKVVGTAAEVISGAASHEWTDSGTQATFFTDLADGDRIFFRSSVTHLMNANRDFDHADLKITFDAQAIIDGNDGTQWTLTFSGDRIQVYQGRFDDFSTSDLVVSGDYNEMDIWFSNAGADPLSDTGIDNVISYHIIS